MIGSGLAGLLALGMFGLGVAACALPGPTSALYGVPERSPEGLAWVRAAGLRDLGLGSILAWALVQGEQASAGVAAIAAGLVAVGDLMNVLATRRPRPMLALAVHASGIVGGVGCGALLLAGDGAPL